MGRADAPDACAHGTCRRDRQDACHRGACPGSSSAPCALARHSPAVAVSDDWRAAFAYRGSRGLQGNQHPVRLLAFHGKRLAVPWLAGERGSRRKRRRAQGAAIQLWGSSSSMWLFSCVGSLVRTSLRWTYGSCSWRLADWTRLITIAARWPASAPNCARTSPPARHRLDCLPSAGTEQSRCHQLEFGIIAVAVLGDITGEPLPSKKPVWIGIGFSHHSVPSLSKTAIRAAGTTKAGPP